MIFPVISEWRVRKYPSQSNLRCLPKDHSYFSSVAFIVDIESHGWMKFITLFGWYCDWNNLQASPTLFLILVFSSHYRAKAVSLICLIICMYEYMNVWMFLCMYVCKNVWMYVWMYVCTYVYMNVCKHVCMYICILWSCPWNQGLL